VLRSYGALIDDIIAWGGEDNLQPEYGQTFLSIKFKGDVTQSLEDTTKFDIGVLVDQLSIASFGLQFTDPVETFVETNIFFQYNPDYTNLSINALQEQVKNTISDYFSTNTGKFGQAFRRSNLLTLVDDVSPAILSSRADVKMQQRFTPSAGVEQDFKFSFPSSIANPDDVNFIIESSTFKRTFGGQSLNCKVRNLLNTNKLQIIDVGTGDVKSDNVGFYESGSGTINLVGFKSDESKLVKLSCTPANASAIVPQREYILNSDSTRLSAKGLRTTASN
jgi:hypothetical protein